jgi:plasmid stability protein
MPYIQIKNMSDEAYNLLKQKAIVDKRSVQQEATWLLEQILLNQPFSYKQEAKLAAGQVREEIRKYHGTLPDSTKDIRKSRDER